MAPLPQYNTRRWYYTYENARNPHTLMLRGNADSTTADADAVVAAILSAIGNRFAASTIVKVEFSTNGENTRFLVDSDRLGDSFGTGSPTPAQDATELTFTGKSTGGRRVRLGIFGWMSDTGDFRQTSDEDSEVAAVVNLLNDAGNVPVGIDNFSAIWHSYANIKPNDHWVKKSR